MANPSKILEVFHDFYSNLYRPHTIHKAASLSKFLEGLPILSLSSEHKDSLEALFTEGQVRGVISALKSGSAPGPDGLSNPYYKTFTDTLVPHLTKFLNAKMQGDPLDPQINTAFIAVIPKPDKNPEEVGNYRPISLINSDLKILTKILANHLANFISSYIHKDKVGFIPGRQGPDQIRQAIDIVSILQTNWTGGPKQSQSSLVGPTEGL